MAHAVADFEARLQRALDRVRLVLAAERVPCFATSVHHQYQDKFQLAESLTNTAAASQLNCLAPLGLRVEDIETLRAWAREGAAVSLRFRSEERCRFVREAKRSAAEPRKLVHEVSVGGMVRGAITCCTVSTAVTDYFWNFQLSYELTAVRGVGQNPSDLLVLQRRAASETLATSTSAAPRPEARVPAVLLEVNVTWLFRHLGEGLVPSFAIDRASPKCHTPRRNPDVAAAVVHFGLLRAWAQEVASYAQQLLHVQPDPPRKLDLAAVSCDSVFAPVLPLLADPDAENPERADEPGAPGLRVAAGPDAAAGVLASVSSPALPGLLPRAEDLNLLLAEEIRQLSEKREGLTTSFPSGDMVASAAEAILVVTLMHCSNLCEQWREAMDYIENMIRKQLIDAIGKEVSPADFADYMRFHNRKLFNEAYAPLPFCFAVRRSNYHTPEGTVSIEEQVVGPGGDSNIASPVTTIAACSSSAPPMRFALGASTTVTFGGDRYLHGWLSHAFSGQSGAKASVVARARQFSSMMVLLGRITSATTFDPKYAIIVQNKDELTIPLELTTIPTPGEFKDAIESLSPEQQAFAKAIRAMQLESTLFGLLVIQIKPQLEKVLNLPEDTLTKEIRLTQDLMQLFIKYQIPSDLLSYEPEPRVPGSATAPADVSAGERLEAVRRHVQAMQDMIAKCKEDELANARMEASYAREGWRAGAVVEQGLLLSDLEDDGCCVKKKKKKHMKRDKREGKDKERCKSVQREECEDCEVAMEDAVGLEHGDGAGGQEASQPQGKRPTGSAAAGPMPAAGRDYTQVPKEMDEKVERFDTDGALRAAIITPAESWSMRVQKALLAGPCAVTLGSTEQKTEKDAAFDLLDALTKSGALPMEHASLHVVVAATHCFDKSVLETVVQDNVNPIEKVERSTLIMANTIHQRPVRALLRDAQRPRVEASSPMLFLDHGIEAL